MRLFRIILIALSTFLLVTLVEQASAQPTQPDLDTDTNADTICSGTTTYLDGEGNCDTLVISADTNANTICTGTTTYLDGEGSCDTLDTTDDDLSDDSITSLDDVTGWTDYKGSIGTTCGGSCSGWAPSWDFFYGKNEGGLCTIVAHSNGATVSVAAASYLTITLLPWKPRNYAGTGQSMICGIAYPSEGSNGYEGMAWAIDDTDELRVYMQDLTTFGTGKSWAVNFTCVYYCVDP